jgi:hypothetical protein
LQLDLPRGETLARGFAEEKMFLKILWVEFVPKIVEAFEALLSLLIPCVTS